MTHTKGTLSLFYQRKNRCSGIEFSHNCAVTNGAKPWLHVWDSSVRESWDFIITIFLTYQLVVGVTWKLSLCFLLLAIPVAYGVRHKGGAGGVCWTAEGLVVAIKEWGQHKVAAIPSRGPSVFSSDESGAVPGAFRKTWLKPSEGIWLSCLIGMWRSGTEDLRAENSSRFRSPLHLHAGIAPSLPCSSWLS